LFSILCYEGSGKGKQVHFGVARLPYQVGVDPLVSFLFLDRPSPVGKELRTSIYSFE